MRKGTWCDHAKARHRHWVKLKFIIVTVVTRSGLSLRMMSPLVQSAYLLIDITPYKGSPRPGKQGTLSA